MTPISRVANLRFLFRLAGRFMRSAAIAHSASIVFAAGLFLMAMFVTLQTLSLSGVQVVERDLGRFGAFVGYGTVAVKPGDDTIVRDVHGRAIKAGASDVMVSLVAVDVQLSTAKPRELTLQEADWSSRPFPHRYLLLSGRWPTRAGEVVVTNPGDVPAAVGTSVTALGGEAQFQVVGIADDRYARSSGLLAGQGTWASLSPRVVERFPLLQSQLVLYWSGNAVDSVLAAFDAVLEGREGGRGETVAVVESFKTRDNLAAAPERTWISRTPAGYTIPSLLLPLGAVSLVFGLNVRRFRRTITVLTSLGVRPSISVASLSLAAIGWSLVAACCGAAAGTAMGAVARMAIVDLRDQPSGPVNGLAAPLVRLLGLIVVGAACAGVLLYVTWHTQKASSIVGATSGGRRTLGRDVRHLLALAAWCGTILFALRVDSPPKAMVLAGALTVGLLLVVPELVDLVVGALPEGEPRLRLGRRQLASDRRRVSAAVALLAVTLGASLGYLTLLDTLVKTANEQSYPDVLPGQLLISDRASQLLPAPPLVLRAVYRSGIVEGRPRLEMRYVLDLDSAGNATRTASPDGSNGSILAVDSVKQVELLVNHSLTQGQRTSLQDGGILLWADAADMGDVTPSRSRLAIASGDVLVGRTRDIPVASITVGQVGWRVGTTGVLLTSSARGLGLPITTGAVIYTGLAAAQAEAVQGAVVGAGVDAKTIQVYKRPPPAIPPAALLATAVGLVVLVLSASLVATRGQARVLRGYLGQLVSIGLPISWARQVLLYQHVVIVAISTLLGLLIAIPPVVIATLQISGFVLSIPWGQILVLIAAIYLATCAAALHSSRQLRARDSVHEDA